MLGKTISIALVGGLLVAAVPAWAAANNNVGASVAPAGGATVQPGVQTPPAPKSCPDKSTPKPDGTCPDSQQMTTRQGGSNTDTNATPQNSMK